MAELTDIIVTKESLLNQACMEGENHMTEIGPNLMQVIMDVGESFMYAVFWTGVFFGSRTIFSANFSGKKEEGRRMTKKCRDCWHFASWKVWVPAEKTERDFLCTHRPKWLDAQPDNTCDHWEDNSTPYTNCKETQERVRLYDQKHLP